MFLSENVAKLEWKSVKHVNTFEGFNPCLNHNCKHQLKIDAGNYFIPVCLPDFEAN